MFNIPIKGLTNMLYDNEAVGNGGRNPNVTWPLDIPLKENGGNSVGRYGYIKG